MYEVFQTAISANRFDLTALTEKVTKYHVEGKLTDEQRDSLLAQAQAQADPHNSYGSWQDEADKLWAAIRELQTTEPPVEEYPQWVQPTGAHDAYPLGAKVTYKEKRYESAIGANVWSPDVYPSGWKLQ